MAKLTEKRVREIAGEEIVKYMNEYMPPKVKMDFPPVTHPAKPKVKIK